MQKQRLLAGVGAVVLVTAMLLPAGAITASAQPVAAHATSSTAVLPTGARHPKPTHPAVLSPTPYMGRNTYYGLGGDYTAAQVLDVAHKLVSSGLARAGYNIVWLDGGWQTAVPRGADGLL